MTLVSMLLVTSSTKPAARQTSRHPCKSVTMTVGLAAMLTGVTSAVTSMPAAAPNLQRTNTKAKQQTSL
jgi:hypothetical protein